ncbi:MAG: TonB-dependent receptor [Dysgonamonadaceae bacterium]|jgi:outer membrane receptor for ferrienterochelin and colicins|nr:TonB-dependent receptor [Dysgonamonadaceae bacterium]
MKKIILVTLLIISTLAAQSHDETDANIHGHVLDRVTQEHIPFATISVKGEIISVAADATGHYRINNLPVKTITVIASFVGYKSQEIEINTVEGKTIEVNFELTESSIELEQVVVSANRRETNRREAVSLVNLVTPLTFEISNSSTLADGLNFQPGLRVENTCNNCGFPQLRINGLEGPYTQILIDSRPINSALAGVYGLEHIPANMVERVEIVRGGASALFGSSAIGGTVNIITRETLQNTVSVSNTINWIDGNTPDNITHLNASIVSENNRAGVTLFAASRQRSPFDANNDGFSELGKINMKNAGFRGFYRPTYNSRLTFEYHAIDEFRRGGNNFELPPHKADIAEQTDHTIHSGGFKYDIFFNEGRHALQVYSSAQHIKRESYYGAEQDPDAYGHTEDFSLVSGAQFTHRMNRLWFMPATFIGGLEYSHNWLHDQMLGHDRNIEQTMNIYSAFAQNEWSNRRASILLGARLEKHSMMDNPILSPRIAARYTPLPWLNLRAGFATGYRGPQAFDEDLHVAVVGGDVALIHLDEDLRPERSHTFTLSGELTRHFSNGQALQFLVEGFYTSLRDVFVLEEEDRADGTLDLIRTNGDGAVVAGVNLEANFVASRKFQINSGFTIQTAKYTEPEEWSSNLEPQRQMFRAPNTYGYITALYSPIRPLDLSLTGTYTGSMLVQHFGAYDDEGVQVQADREVDTPAFFDLGFRTAYNFNLRDNVTLQLNGGVRNIFNSYQRDFDKDELRDAGYIYGPTLPRTVFVGMKLSI